MSYSKNVWDRLRNTTVENLIKALEKDGWEMEPGKSAVRVYRKSDGSRVTIHYHPKKTFGASLLKGLISDIGWNEQDLKRLKLI